jgi:hypothetical protein
MKIGEYITIDEIKNQSICRWVVLVDLDFSAQFGGLEGGIVKFIEDTKTEAGNKAAELNLNGTDATIICGALEDLSVGGVFVK